MNAVEISLKDTKSKNLVYVEEIKQLKSHNTNMSIESNIIQKRMIDMQNDFNKYKESKEIIENKQKEIDKYKKENDKLSLELMMIKSNESNTVKIDENKSKNIFNSPINEKEQVSKDQHTVTLSIDKYNDLIKSMEDMAYEIKVKTDILDKQKIMILNLQGKTASGIDII